MPSTNTTPGQPTNVTAQLDVTGGIRVSCDAPPLAQRFRWRMLIVGAETKYRLVAGTVDPTALIKGAMPGDTVRIIVQAVNGGSQGVASEPIEFTVPLVEKVKTAGTETAAPTPEPTAAVKASGASPAAAQANGANGHGRRHRMTAV